MTEITKLNEDSFEISETKIFKKDELLEIKNSLYKEKERLESELSSIELKISRIVDITK